MSLALRVLIVFFAALSAAGLAQAQEQRFTHEGVQGDAKRYEAYLKANWQPKANAQQQRAEGDKVLAGGTDPRAAARGSEIGRAHV